MDRRTPHSTALRSLVAVALSVIAMFASSPVAEAHTVGLSRASFRTTDRGIEGELQLARADALTLAPWLDVDRNGTIEPGEAILGSERFAEDAFALVLVTRLGEGDTSCKAEGFESKLVEEDGMLARAHLVCAEPPASFAVDASKLLDTLPRGHRAIALLSPAGATEPAEQMLFRGSGRAEATGNGGGPAVAPVKRGTGAILGEYFVLGVEHILTGIDHIVFLLGLLLLGGRLKSILWMVTAFTVAHSITLGLAVLGIFAPSGSFVEPMIALSVAYVGVENFVVKDVDKRWRITALFGLIHGFGFAGALGEIALPHAQLPIALLAFNVGVEAGQLGLLAVALPIILKLREREWFRDKGMRVASGAIVAAGVIWFVTRVLGVA